MLAFSFSLVDRRGCGVLVCPGAEDGAGGGGFASKTAWKRVERSKYSSSSGPSGGSGMASGVGATLAGGGSPVSQLCGTIFWTPVPSLCTCSQEQNLCWSLSRLGKAVCAFKFSFAWFALPRLNKCLFYCGIRDLVLVVGKRMRFYRWEWELPAFWGSASSGEEWIPGWEDP